uniref:Flocculation protein FLO11-like n=1 Tax=Steinernema glaseri TaxID=37863 RepID=A0A1I7YWV4_9BILA
MLRSILPTIFDVLTHNSPLPTSTRLSLALLKELDSPTRELDSSNEAALGDELLSSVGSPKLVHMASADPQDGPFRRENSGDVYANVDDEDLDGLIEGRHAGCLSFEEQQDCIADAQQEGFFSPILPTPSTPVVSTAASRRRTSSPSPSPRSALTSPPPTSATVPATVLYAESKHLLQPVHFHAIQQRPPTTMSIDVDYGSDRLGPARMSSSSPTSTAPTATSPRLEVEVVYDEEDEEEDEEEPVTVAKTAKPTVPSQAYRKAIGVGADYLEDLWSDLEPPTINTVPTVINTVSTAINTVPPETTRTTTTSTTTTTTTRRTTIAETSTRRSTVAPTPKSTRREQGRETSFGCGMVEVLGERRLRSRRLEHGVLGELLRRSLIRRNGPGTNKGSCDDLVGSATISLISTCHALQDSQFVLGPCRLF